MEFYRHHRGFITITTLVVLSVAAVLFLFGYAVLLAFSAGVGTGAATLFLTRDIRDYNNDFLDMSDTD